PTAYLNNPAEERARYAYDVDKEMTLLRFEDASTSSPLGMINWFAVHGTSMNNWNTLISGDNKGYAALLFAKFMTGGNFSFPGMGPFVAIFGQSNEGDVSPNTLGAFCWNGQPCEEAHSTCGGESQGCRGYGPGGLNDFLSTKIIGSNQFEKALDLFLGKNSSSSSFFSLLLSGPLDYIHQFVDMTNVSIPNSPYSSNNASVTTCPSALGDSFAAG